MTRSTMDVAFSPAVRALQQARGSREGYARMEARRPWPDRITPDLSDFVARQTSVFLGTASAAGQPYIQHRGGPAGFLKPMGEQQLGWAERGGNRQYISHGNLSENPSAVLFLIDYDSRRRVKIWGRARVIEEDAALIARLAAPDAAAAAERAILFEVEAWDLNCPRHIPRRLGMDRIATLLAERDARIAMLEAELAAARGTTQDPAGRPDL